MGIFGLRNPNLGGGVIVLKLYDPRNGLRVGNAKNSHFRAKSAKKVFKCPTK